jgi:glutathione S-transferase
MLMLAHKGLPYKRVDLLTLTHPVAARMLGFDAGGERREAGGKRTLGLRIGDRLGTVPALAAGERRISTNHAIARFLDEKHPAPALFPSDPAGRVRVEEAEAWANETLQMEARRILGAAAVRDPAGFSRHAGTGRMGYLLYRHESVRSFVVSRILSRVFVASPKQDSDLLATLSSCLDRIDAWIQAGVLGGKELNVADFMVAPSLALILYRQDVQPLFEGRPALELVDRLLPDPSGSRD